MICTSLQATANGEEHFVFAIQQGHAGVVLITLDVAMCEAAEQDIFAQHTIASRCSNDVLDRTGPGDES